MGRARLFLVVPVLSTLLLAGAVLPGASGAPDAPSPWRGDFETGDFSQWNWGVQQKEAGRATIVRSPTRQGRYAARFEVRPGDCCAGGTSGERTEVLASQETTDGYEGREQFWAWSTMFDASFRANSSPWNTFTQWHNSGTWGGTTAFQARGKTIWFDTFGGDPSHPIRKSWRIVKKRVNSKWYDFVLHVTWSSDPKVGFVQVWVDRKLVVPKTFTATLYYGQSVYLKQGYYRNQQPRVGVIYQDGMRRGPTLADVVDWGGNRVPR